MAVLTDAWARRLKSCLEHVVQRPISIDPSMPSVSTSRLVDYSIFTLLTRGLLDRSPVNTVHVSLGRATVQNGGYTIEIRIPPFTAAEQEQIIITFASRIMYAALLAAWRARALNVGNHPVIATAGDLAVVKDHLELDLIDRGIHVIPHEPGSLTISCECGGTRGSPAGAKTEATGTCCQHAYHALPSMLVKFDSEPSLIFSARGLSINDLESRVLSHVQHVHRHAAAAPPNATSGGAAIDAASMLASYWTYPSPATKTPPATKSPAGSLAGEGIPPATMHPFDAARFDPDSSERLRSPPARLRSILSAIYAHVEGKHRELEKVDAFLAKFRASYQESTRP